MFAALCSRTASIYDGDLCYRVRQYALFADASYKITDQWKFEAGLRWYRYQSDSANSANGFFAPPPAPVQEFTISDSGFNPRFDLSYAPNTDLTTYISASKGFRPGGPAGPNYPSYCGGGQTPPYAPDSVWDYEVGEKAKLFEQLAEHQQRLLLHQVEPRAGDGGPSVRLHLRGECR